MAKYIISYGGEYFKEKTALWCTWTTKASEAHIFTSLKTANEYLKNIHVSDGQFLKVEQIKE